MQPGGSPDRSTKPPWLSSATDYVDYIMRLSLSLSCRAAVVENIFVARFHAKNISRKASRASFLFCTIASTGFSLIFSSHRFRKPFFVETILASVPEDWYFCTPVFSGFKSANAGNSKRDLLGLSTPKGSFYAPVREKRWPWLIDNSTATDVSSNAYVTV